MARIHDDQNAVRQYLLRQLSDDENRTIEQRLLAEDDLFEELEIAEDELIDEYLAGKLSEKELKIFEQNFLVAPPGKRKRRFAEAVKRQMSTSTPEGPVTKRGWFSQLVKWLQLSLFSSPLVVAALVLIVAGVGFVVWRGFVYQSDVDKGLIALNSAYRQQRPVEARISKLDYAPFVTTRGGEPERVNTLERDRAERILLDAVRYHQGAASHHALGKFYLTRRDFDKAIEQFEEALKSGPSNAQLHSDLGAAFLEKARAQQSGGKPDGRLELLGLSLEHLNRALALNDSLLEALFNRALCYQDMTLIQQAKEDWLKYLSMDTRGGWADEARRHLKAIQTLEQQRTSFNEEQVLENVVNAYKAGDREAVWQTVARNREAITGRLVWQQLVNDYLDLMAQRRYDRSAQTLRVLRFVAEVEQERSEDSYTTNVAEYYALLPQNRVSTLWEAQGFFKRGYASCLESRFGEALESFRRAAVIFNREGDVPEVMAADYWIGYSAYQITKTKESELVLLRLGASCEKKRYRWLSAQVFNLLATVKTAGHEYSKGIDYTHRALAISDQISDNYGTQKNLAQLANEERSLGGYQESLAYLQRCLELSARSWPGVRQMWRNYDTTSRVFYSLGLYPAAAAYSKEALQLAWQEIKDPSVIYVSQVHSGLIYGQFKEYEEGIRQAERGLEIGYALPDRSVGEKVIAYSSLQLGYLYRQMGALEKSLLSYNYAIEIYDRLSFEVFTYDAHKGRLLCYLAQGDNQSAREELKNVLALFEKYRSRILEEGRRNNFFNVEQSVYDLAIDFEFSKDGNQQLALDYSEISRARSLLDLLKSESQSSPVSDEPTKAVATVALPLTLVQVQARMSDNTQVLQYAVLENRVIFWVITKTNVSTGEKEIPLSELTKKVIDYQKLVSSPSALEDADRQRAAANLYDLLIKPVEATLVKEKQLCIIPDKVLNYLPFASLISSSGRYLIEDFSILYSPSSSVFVAASDRAQQKSQTQHERLLSVGNPSFDHDAFQSFHDLPSAEKEAQEIGGFYDSKRCLTGGNASKARVLGEMGKADVVHLAAHYVVDAKFPLRSKLLLAKQSEQHDPSDRRDSLEAGDIYDLKSLPTRVIVLSACLTNAQGYYKGEGAVGFSRAFLAVGVPVVVATQWAVDSDSTEAIMVSFHRLRKLSGMSSVEALKQAQVEMLHSSAGDYRRPYYWAPFIAVGGYASF